MLEVAVFRKKSKIWQKSPRDQISPLNIAPLDSITRIVRSVLMYDNSQYLDISEYLFNFGMDSVSAMQIRNGIQKKFGVSMSISDLYRNTIENLTKFIMDLKNDTPEILSESNTLPVEIIVQ